MASGLGTGGGIEREAGRIRHGIGRGTGSKVPIEIRTHGACAPDGMVRRWPRTPGSHPMHHILNPLRRRPTLTLVLIALVALALAVPVAAHHAPPTSPGQAVTTTD